MSLNTLFNKPQRRTLENFKNNNKLEIPLSETKYQTNFQINI